MPFLAGRMAVDRQTGSLQSYIHLQTTTPWGSGLWEWCWPLLPRSLPPGIGLHQQATPPLIIVGPFVFKPPQCRMKNIPLQDFRSTPGIIASVIL